MSDKSFQTNLWDGIDLVYKRFDEGKRSLADMIDIFSMRQKLEEHYAKDLQKLCSKPAGTAEARTFGTGYSKLKEDNENQTRLRYNFVSVVSKDILQELKNLQSDQNKSRANLQAKVSALQAELDKKGKALQKAKSAFHSKSEAAESALSQYEKAQQDPTCQPKQLSKLNGNQQKLRKEADSADSQYNAIVLDHQQFQLTFETQMKEVLAEFQRMEETRLLASKRLMEKYQQETSSLLDELKKSTEELGAALAQMDGISDTQAWISENQTDRQPPPPVEYIPYKQQYSHPNSGNTAPSTRTSSSVRPVSQRSGSIAAVSSPSPVSAPRAASTPSAAKTVKARALYDFDASDDTEVSFRANDVLIVVKQDNSGWWHGTNKGRTGMFPANYVELVSEGSTPTRAPAPNVRQCRVLYEFSASTPDELGIAEGEIITIDVENEGWYTGTNARGQSGMFPANYVELI